jgi:hypothetical protein
VDRRRFSIGFFGPTLGLARWSGQHRQATLTELVERNIGLATGGVLGREAMVQLLTIPITLAVGATIIGMVFLIER